MSCARVPVLLVALSLATLSSLGAPAPASDPVLWPERHRAFLQDGPAWLLQKPQLEALLSADAAGRQALIEEFLDTDPIPETPENELRQGIRRRQRLALEELLSPRDVRAKLLFLNGPPQSVEPIECGVTFKPIEIWTYGSGEASRELVLYRPETTRSFELWLPIESKRVLYTREMEYYMDQYAAVRGAGFRDQPDRFFCPDARRIEQATGIRQLNRYMRGRPTNEELLAYVAPPEDLAAWARAAARTELPERPEEIPVETLSIYFPNRDGQRIVTAFYLTIPAGVELESVEVEDGAKREIRLDVTAVLEQGDEIFDEFKARFKLAPPQGRRLVLALEQPLRPNREFVVRFRIEDEIGGRRAYVARGFRVPAEHEKLSPPPPPEDEMVAMAQEMAAQRIAGADSLVLVPPMTDIVVGVWRAEALVTGRSIEEVTFSVDGKKQLTRRRPPWTAEVKLAEQPTEQIVSAEGFDAEGNLVARDEVILNQPTGALRVRILSPERGVAVSGAVDVRAEVVVPENRRVEQVEFLVNDELVATTTRPPWEATVEVPGGADEVAYLAVVATLDNGNRAEDVRFLNSPRYLEQVDVKLVELLTTVTGRDGRLVRDLEREDFRVFEDGRPQEIRKFELVEDLPLTVGIAIDSSSSMVSSLPQAQAAAVDFLESVVTPRDRVFAVGFAGQPVLLVPPTDDVSAVEDALTGLRSVGMTTLHDAIVTSLYYFRGVRGRKALIILSDGEDTASHMSFNNALEYARRSGVVIYTIGLNIGPLQTSIRGKLNDLARETGGQVFHISRAEDLRGVYRTIEEELRSQYLITYSSDRPTSDGSYREVEVKVEGKYKARTMSGYYG